MNIGEALSKTRENQNRTQTEVAKTLKISQTYLSQIEGGKKKPSMDMLESLAKIYNTSVPAMMWFALTEKDIQQDKLHLFKLLKPVIDNLAKNFI